MVAERHTQIEPVFRRTLERQPALSVMSFMWTMIIVWLAVQIPLGMLIGKCIQRGTDDAPRLRTNRAVWARAQRAVSMIPAAR